MKTLLAALLLISASASANLGAAIGTPAPSASSIAGAVVTTMSGTGVTCADSGNGSAGTLTLDPTCPIAGGTVIVPLVNSDADGCTITMAETSALVGCRALIYVASSAGGNISAAAVSNVFVPTAATWKVLATELKDSLQIVYEDLADDAWVETARTSIATVRVTTGSDNKFYIQKTDGTQNGIIYVGGSGTGVFEGSVEGVLGCNANAAAGTVCASIYSNNGGTELVDWTGGGVYALKKTQAVTCASDGAGTTPTQTLDATSSVVLLTNSDPQGCNITIQETTAKLGADVKVFLVSTAGGTITFANQANVFLTAAGSCTFASVGSMMEMFYVDMTDDAYVLANCHTN